MSSKHYFEKLNKPPFQRWLRSFMVVFLAQLLAVACCSLILYNMARFDAVPETEAYAILMVFLLAVAISAPFFLVVAPLLISRWHYHPEGRLAPGTNYKDYFWASWKLGEILIISGIVLVALVGLVGAFFGYFLERADANSVESISSSEALDWLKMMGVGICSSLFNALGAALMAIFVAVLVGIPALALYAPLVAIFAYIFFGLPNKTQPRKGLMAIEGGSAEHSLVSLMKICTLGVIVPLIVVFCFSFITN